MATKKTKDVQVQETPSEVPQDQQAEVSVFSVTENTETVQIYPVSWQDNVVESTVEQHQVSNVTFQPEVEIEMLEGNKFYLEHATDGSAGFDVRAAISEPIKLIRGGRAQLIPLGFKMHLADPNFVAVLVPRSGNGHKRGLVMGNGTGVIDSDYLGQVYVSAWARPNRTQWTATHEHDFIDGDTPEYILINPGDRIGQLMFIPVAHPKFKVVEKLSGSTARGEGGFSSTGTK